MIWILTMPVIWFFAFKNICYDSNFPEFGHEPRNFLGWAIALLVGVVVSFLLSLIPVWIATFIGGMPERIGKPAKRYPLVALREKDGAAGRFFFLGAGSLEDVQYYFWYRKNDDGSVSGGKTERESGVRIYEDTDAPYMQTFKAEYKAPSVARYLWLVGMDMRSEEDWFPDFHIPAGSIKEGYVL
jgi:hypothetical protein